MNLDRSVKGCSVVSRKTASLMVPARVPLPEMKIHRRNQSINEI
jgi:hypothetical protein